jgi:hypothetical protein
MPTFATNTVHGLSCDAYFDGVAVRLFGDVVVAQTNESLPLTANDEGNVNPVAVLRRGDMHQITLPVADATGLFTTSGLTNPFASGVTSVSGTTSGQTMILLPKAQPGDNYLNKAKELRLVLRDGSETRIYPKAVCIELEDLTMSEEKQMVQGAVFQAFRVLVSGVETPFVLVSGSVISGGYSIG